MRPPTPLPDELGDEFSVAQARRLGVSARRLRARDLARPFPGVRVRIHPLAARPSAQPSGAGDHPNEVARAHEAARLRALAARASPDQFFSHRSAAVLWGAPLPPPRSSSELHLATLRPNRAPRVTGVRGHSFMADRVRVQLLEGRIAVTDPASTWASLGELSVDQLVIAGDYFVRKYRQGVGRRDAGRQPLCRLDELAVALSRGRWDGMPGLRRALPLIRGDSWSPQETATRVALVRAGLPEPDLNRDVFDARGSFLGCLDLVWPRWKVAVEYHGQQHANTYASDIERVERLRAAGWVVIQVTRVLASRLSELTARVAQALDSRGWRPAA